MNRPKIPTWFAHRRRRDAAAPPARVRLFCLPYAGGGALAYRTWVQELPETIDVCPIQLPGREQRLREQPYTRVEPLTEALVGALAPELEDLPFALFGHSMGALIAYEVAHRLRSERGLAPVRLLVSGRSAPHLFTDEKNYHRLPDAELKQVLRNMEGTPQEILDHDELMELMLPIIRADFKLTETYSPRQHPPLDCPIDAFGGLTDPEVDRQELEGWSELTAGPFRLRMFRGGHFFIHSERASLLAAVRESLS